MLRTSRQAVIVGVSLLLAAAMGVVVIRSKSDTATLAFWFINFRSLAHGAIAYAPPDARRQTPDASRQEIIAAIE